MRLRGVATIFAVIASLALASACTRSSSESGGTSSTAGPAQAGTLRIGIDLPVSGADASIGIPTQNGAVLAIEQANARGLPGGFKLEASTLDDAVQGVHDPAQGAQNVKTFIADPTVMGIIGPFNSNVAKAQIPLTNDAGITQIAPSTTNPGLTKGDDAAKLRTAHPTTNSFFRVCTTDDRQGAAGAQFAHKLGFRKAFIVDDDETYGKGLADVFEQQFRALGGMVLGHEHLTKGQQDFKALLTKANSLGPDMIFYGGTTSSGGGLLRKQMGDVGMKALPYVGGDGISDEEFVKTAGDMANNTYFTVAAPDTANLPSAKAFVAAYMDRFKSPVGPYSANSYTAAAVEIAAIRKAIEAAGGKQPTRDAVLKYVAATRDFESPIGNISFDHNGDVTEGILSLYQIKDGKTQFVNQITIKS